MSPVPAFEIGFWNAWLFMAVYPIHWIISLLVSRQTVERTGHTVYLEYNRTRKILGWLTTFIWILATLYSIFLPLAVGTTWFYIGLLLFIIGVFMVVSASITVERTAADLPFTTGLYRFSRHPMYLSMIFVYSAVSISAASWLFAAITLITFFQMRYQMILEEQYCCEVYGQTYRDYMNRTPRWLGLPER